LLFLSKLPQFICYFFSHLFSYQIDFFLDAEGDYPPVGKIMLAFFPVVLKIIFRQVDLMASILKANMDQGVAETVRSL
jgi:hypothetical protein